MEPEFDLQSRSKRLKRSDFDLSSCLFCEKEFSESSPAIKPDINRMDSLFNACRQRQDETGKRLLECEDEIRNGNVTFRYHRSCRATYASPTHIKRYIEKQALSSPIAGPSSKDPCEESEVQTPRLTRQTLGTLKFDWKQYCFICGKTCSSKKKSEWANVVSSIDSEEDSMYTKVFKAAQARRDDAMLVRLGEVPNGDSEFQADHLILHS